jgi:hypothetical protein
MATLVLDDCYVIMNSTAISGVRQVAINHQVNAVDDTVMGQDTQSNLPALKNWNASITFAQDFNGTAVDSQLNGLMGSRFLLQVRVTSSARSTQNPEYQGYAMITDYGIFSGSPGDFAEAPVSLVPAKSSTGGTSTADLTRVTSST